MSVMSKISDTGNKAFLGGTGQSQDQRTPTAPAPLGPAGLQESGVGVMGLGGGGHSAFFIENFINIFRAK